MCVVDSLPVFLKRTTLQTNTDKTIQEQGEPPQQEEQQRQQQEQEREQEQDQDQEQQEQQQQSRQ